MAGKLSYLKTPLLKIAYWIVFIIFIGWPFWVVFIYNSLKKDITPNEQGINFMLGALGMFAMIGITFYFSS